MSIDVRKILDDRRYAELEMDAIQRQIDKSCAGTLRGLRSSLPSREKVPGKEEWIYRLPGTNNPEGAALQHEEGYTEALLRLMDEKSGLCLLAEQIVASARLSIDRTILRYYYCQALTDEQVAEIVSSSRRAVCKRRNEAVDDLAEQWAGK